MNWNNVGWKDNNDGQGEAYRSVTSGAVQRKSVTLKVSLTACTLTMYDARDQIANELRRIADNIEEGSLLGESGNMGICDHGSWELPDPWEEPNAELTDAGPVTPASRETQSRHSVQ